MSRLGQAFWAIAAIDAVLLAVLLVMTLQQRSVQNDGGREMGLFFFIMLPGFVLALAMLLFHFSTSLPAKSIALFIVLVPGLYFAKQQIEGSIVDRRIEANRLGVGYFDTEPMRQMGAAVVRRDVETLMRIGPGVDVNAPGRDTMTLLLLAVSSADSRVSDGSDLPVVRALLALGAKADAAMHTACVRLDSDLLATLLAAGGNPNLKAGGHQALVFDTMSSITPSNFRLLAQHGLDLNSRSYDDPLPVQLSIYRRWDLLAIAIELGADTTRARPDGRNVADELAGQIDEEKKAGREPPADLLHASALLAVVRKKQ
ncbi:MAG: ankyrin repeat domain-containing protein [Burkholderiaceae bacterium]